MTIELLQIIAVDHIRHEFNASTPVAGEPELIAFPSLRPAWLVEVAADNSAYLVGINDGGDVFAASVIGE